MKRVGLIGWRGMVGSVLMQRMLEERDFDLIEPVFFTTSNVGGQGPDVGKDIEPLKDAYSIDELKGLDVILTCQGGDYTNEVFPKLLEAGWDGYWIDAASALRMADNAVIVLDPVNRKVIDQSLDAGIKNYIGGNCTVSLIAPRSFEIYAAASATATWRKGIHTLTISRSEANFFSNGDPRVEVLEPFPIEVR